MKTTSTLCLRALLLFGIVSWCGTVFAQNTACQLVRNPDCYTTGANWSDLPALGSETMSNAWARLSMSPQTVTSATGCGGSFGSIFMWGTKTTHEAAGQNLTTNTITNGTWYKLRLCARKAPASNAPIDPDLRVFAFNGNYIWGTTPTVAGTKIGSRTVPNVPWASFGDVDFPIWKATANANRLGMNCSNTTPTQQANILVDSVQLIPVCCLLDVSASVVPPATNCCYTIQLKNLVDNISMYALRITVQPGFSIASSAPPLGFVQSGTSQIVTWNRSTGAIPMGSYNGQLCLNSSSGATSATVVFEWMDSTGTVICTTRKTLRCPPPCIEVIDGAQPHITCVPDSAGIMKYQACVAITNHCEFTANLSVSGIGTNNLTIVSMSPTSIPGTSSATVCVTFIDAPPLDATACFRFSATYGKDTCSKCQGSVDSVCVKLPTCPCISITSRKIACLAPGTYQLAVGLNSAQSGTLSITPMAGSSYDVASITPASIPAGYNGVVNATWSNSTNANVMCFIVSLMSGSQTICKDTFCIDVPKCPDGCATCPFKYVIPTQGSGYLWNIVVLNSFISAPSVKEVTASIVSASVTQRCGSGGWTAVTPVSTSILGASLPGFVVSGVGTSEAVFTNFQCPNLTAAQLGVALQVDPAPPSGCIQRLHICLRYTIMDCKCQKCDTLVCYDLERKYSVWHWIIGPGGKGASIAGADHSKTSTLQSIDTSNPSVNLTMTSPTEGILTVENPPADSSVQAATIRSLTLNAEPGVNLLSMKSLAGGWPDGTPTDSGMSSSGRLSGGNTLRFGLTYANDAGSLSWMNTLRLSFNVPGLSDSTVINHEFELESRVPSSQGGDSLAPERPTNRPSHVQTYALYVSNGNQLKRSIDRVIVGVDSPCSILAVGPPRDSLKTTISLARDRGRSFIFQCDPDTQVQLYAGEAFRPIYVTVGGNTKETTVLNFKTIDTAGNVLTDDSVTVSNPLSQIREQDSYGTIKPFQLLSPYPNPAGQSTTLQIHLEQSELVSLRVVDVQGKEVSTILTNAPLPAGEHVFNYSTVGFVAGTYFVILDTPRGQESTSFTVVK